MYCNFCLSFEVVSKKKNNLLLDDLLIRMDDTIFYDLLINIDLTILSLVTIKIIRC